MTPEIVDLLRRTAREKGLDPDRFVVGGRHNSINPNTGLMEFNDEWENAADDNANSSSAGSAANSACSPGTTSNIGGPPDYSGMASMYGENLNGSRNYFAGRTTANGETMDPNGYTAASVRLHDSSGNLLRQTQIPLGSYVNVVSQNDPTKNVVVKVNDSGPLEPGRVLDLTPQAMETLTGRRYNLAPVNIFRCKP
jgi:rare lipoprotein A (peptidoglycan hydrolase)